MDCAVVLGLGNRVAGNLDLSLSARDVQAAGADLNAQGHGRDLGVLDRQRTGGREVDAETVRNVERGILERNGVVRVVAVRLNTATTSGGHLNGIKDKSSIVPANKANRLIADHVTVLHSNLAVFIVGLECGVNFRTASVVPCKFSQINCEIFRAGSCLLVRAAITQ